VSEWATYVSDRKDGTVRVVAQQVITREIETPERNVRSGTCFDVAMQDLNIPAYLKIGLRIRERRSNGIKTWSRASLNPFAKQRR
jgi:hypothetical protein